MPDTTDIYGIRFPQDGDSIDTAGDMRQLAETSEIALAGVNWDTATDEQKAAVAASTAPVSLFGAGRPDAAGDNIQAPTGSTYTWTGSDPDTVFGARAWRKTPDAWVVEGGYYECTLVQGQPFGLTGLGNITWRFVFQPDTIQANFITAPSASGSTLSALLAEWTFPGMTGPGDISNGSAMGATSTSTELGAYTSYWTGGDPAWQILKFALRSTVWGTAQTTSTPFNNHLVSGMHGWPTMDPIYTPLRNVEDYAAVLEQAAKDNPELAEQLRQELEALRSEDA